MPKNTSKKHLTKKRVLLVDSTNNFLRGYAANSAISDKGEHVGGVITFLYTLARFMKTLPIDKIVCVWDGQGGSSRRRSIFKEYKNKRKPRKKNRFYEYGEKSNSAIQQMMLMDILKSLPVSQACISDCEADDVIAYLTKHFAKQDYNVVILSTDKDFFQLISPGVVVYNPIKRKFIRSQDVIKQYGIHPDNWCVARTMIGDKSDNIDGVHGVGYKNVIKFFPELVNGGDDATTLASLYQKITEVEKPGKTLLRIRSECAILERNYKLMQLDESLLTKEQKMEVQDDIAKVSAMNRGNFRSQVMGHGLRINVDSMLQDFMILSIKRN